jgi:hypothetical protein
LKVDENFKLIWFNRYGATRDETFSSLAIDDEGNMLAAGVTNSFGASLDTTLQLNNLMYYTYIDKNGVMLWDSTLQPNAAQTNRNSSVSTVLFLPNKTFAIVGSTNNYFQSTGAATNPSYTKDAYLFCVDKLGNTLWNGRFYRTPTSIIYAECDEDATNAIVSESGHIIFQMLGEKDVFNTNRAYIQCLNKIEITGPTKFINGQIWRGNEIACIGNRYASPQVLSNKVAMAKTTGDGTVLFDYVSKALIFTDNSGNIIRTTLLGKDIAVADITNNGDKLILTTCGSLVGETIPNIRINKPGWIVTDLNGNILESNEAKLTGNANSIDFTKVFLNTQDEILTFGTIKSDAGTNIIMLRFDHSGNLINK